MRHNTSFNGREAAARELVQFIRGDIQALTPGPASSTRPEMRRSFEYNVLMVRSPGAGKTLLARALPGILMEVSIYESLNETYNYSLLTNSHLKLRSCA